MADVGFEWAFLSANEHYRGGRLREAEEMYRKVLSQRADHGESLQRLGTLLAKTGRVEEGMAMLRRAIAGNAGRADFHLDLGLVLARMGRHGEAADCFRESLRLRPDYVLAHNSLGNSLMAEGELDGAMASYQRAIALKGEWALPHGNLGVVYGAQGQISEAIASYRKALALNPRHMQAHSNLLYTMHLDPRTDEKMLAEEHRRFREMVERSTPRVERHGNSAEVKRRLKVGYVSPDFRLHAVGRFMVPLLKAHDHEKFEIHCFSGVRGGDRVTEELRGHADRWHEIADASDEEVAKLVMAEGIDVLVDLAVHTAGNRSGVFARKPAPVQVTYLGYCSTTGLSTVDYRLSDPYLDPVGEDACYYSEETMRLARTYWCYGEVEGSPEVGALPAKRARIITWGCLNNFSKMNEEALRLWGKLLLGCEGSRLILHAHEGGHRRRTREVFAGMGIGEERYEFVGYLPLEEYLGVYGRIDIGLDTFPYAGGTTTCDALWMGVPVVTMRGKLAVGRGGVSLLSNVGLEEWVAKDEGEYVEKALGLAGDWSRLEEIRKGLRKRMRGSAVMDSVRFAREVEGAYRGMWERWCAKGR